MAFSERNTRAAGLDGLRAIGALSVLCLHVWLYSQPDPAHPSRADVFGAVMFELRLGLVLFFVLSGYLLYRAFAAAALRGAGPVDVVLYARRRLARIVPAYYLALVGAFVLLWGLRGSPGVRLPDAGGLPLFFVFGQNFSHATFLRLNPVTWTLCLEAAFYLALPLVGWTASRLRGGGARAQVRLIAALGALGLAYDAAAYAGGWSAMAGKALPAHLPIFAAGMLVAVWVEARRARAAPLAPAAAGALVVGGFALAIADGAWHATTGRPAADPLLSILGDLPAALGFAALVAAVADGGAGAATGWLRARPLARVGLVSYGVYLWQVPLILFARGHGLLPTSFVPALALMLPVVLAVGAASWHLVERPLIARAGRPRGHRPARRAHAQLEVQAAP